MMLGIPKFRKENHPGRARDKKRPIFSHLLTDSVPQAERPDWIKKGLKHDYKADSLSCKAFCQDAFIDRALLSMFQTNNKHAKTMRVRAMGFSKKMAKEPPLPINDCLKATSMLGPKIMARMKGAKSKSSFRKT